MKKESGEGLFFVFAVFTVTVVFAVFVFFFSDKYVHNHFKNQQELNTTAL